MTSTSNGCETAAAAATVAATVAATAEFEWGGGRIGSSCCGYKHTVARV